MKKVIFSLLTLALVTSISSSALATEKIGATEVKPLAAIFYDREPNDDMEQANPYMIGGQINGELPQFKDREDWYTFTPTRSGKVSLVFAYSKGYMNILKLRVSTWNEPKTPIVQTETPGEVLRFDVVEGKQYYIKVYPYERNSDFKHDYNVYTEYIN
ncbi:hypothetical protein C0R09_14535 [Brevibacillus laterosporus]|uniref:hypothetical protein n=1 Tax=Brevibacillus laterosporus TaxID=1465 RepID=UPI000C76804C|nr:hypothetical protein [Brevibacillus laterosporus]AUM65640.1 hypothetical protein C0R09_14535 [Brevibacillus laterosporus]